MTRTALVIKSIANNIRNMKNWNDVISTLNQTEFLESPDRPFVCMRTVRADELDKIKLDRTIVDKIKERVNDVSRVLTTLIDEISVERTDDSITCSKMFVQAKKELKISFNLKDILSWNFIRFDTVVYIDMLSKKYTKRIMV
jgi:hypothetical protein